MADRRRLQVFTMFPDQAVAELRGIRALEHMGSPMWLGGKPLMDVYMARNGRVAIGSGLVFGDLTYGKDHFYQDWCERYPLADLVIDVHFPLTQPERIFALQPGKDAETRDTDLDYEAAKFWADPVNEAWGLELVEYADIVTTPKAEWAELLAPYNSNVVVLPDVVDPASAAFYSYEFQKLLFRLGESDNAFYRKFQGLVTWALFTNRFAEAGYLADAVTNFEESSLDWSYANSDKGVGT